VTLLEAYERTGRILNVSVSAFNREGGIQTRSMILNYITAPHVVVWSAVAASCAYPGLYTAVQLTMKDPASDALRDYLPGQLWFDGSVAADLPFDRLAELFNANYFIVSQVNPHVIPFLTSAPGAAVHKKSYGAIGGAARRLWYGACHEMKHWLLKMYRFGILSQAPGSQGELTYMTLAQSYTGDVTIRPVRSIWQAVPDYVNLTSNPTPEHMQYVTTTAQRRTWPYLNGISHAMRIERALSRALRHLEERIEAQQQQRLAVGAGGNCSADGAPSAPGSRRRTMHH
jgi:hypothetical protein